MLGFDMHLVNNDLARAACMHRGLYVLLALISFSSFSVINPGAKRTQDLLYRFSPNFHHMVDI